MRINLNENEAIIIRWQYDSILTYCYVENINQEILHTAVISKHFKDRNDKEIARRKSLKKVLTFAFPYDHFNDRARYKNFRTKIWQEYRTMTKTPRW